ncbi:DUF262 domain-containing protein [Helicobacter heilmannii]|uniref:GmrSD restriction endonucleases N-terminal domain-containing protein n=1 Tax=Helicobacter heilmannii TaxID=35817 RepID=A0A0K2YBJ9_HELHE|nr:DUF262 domain-containing protein [Helicobacter heilmannii]BDQ27088.1 hypothetical protein ASB1_07640 [Helicobacter heilmannii]CCM12029.1 FIG00469472: hypothetical protein [Helicobacter heilmannii ASB1.4]CRI34340.1 FIG00469472: hypothetical protein [Helicobacter heilmannii]
MAGFQSPVSINEAMQKIKSREYLIPAFQREYVWGPEQVARLFDSLMRGYPISSMLFWEVKDESKKSWKFYDFLQCFRQKFKTHNQHFDTAGYKDFYAILDGQQRLTSLYLGLFGRYDIHKRNKKWTDEDRNFWNTYLYFNLTQSRPTQLSDVGYEFLWFERDKTEAMFVDEHGQKWFRCGAIYDFKSENSNSLDKVLDFAIEQGFNKEERKRLLDFFTLIFNTPDQSKINFYLETEQDPEKAVNIFIRINSGGTALGYADILFSVAVANWKEIDARTEIHDLVDQIKNKGFDVSKDLILKGFLFLFHHDIRYQIKSFDSGFIQAVEQKWKAIKVAFLETFELLRSFGLNGATLGANNLALPLVYYIYHQNLSGQIVHTMGQQDNRVHMKTWILRALVFKPLGASSDTTLSNMRRAFIKEFNAQSRVYFDQANMPFPQKAIEIEGKYHQKVDLEFLEANVLFERTNTSRAFALLSLLYPNLDYKNNNFHRDHLHPQKAYENYKKLSQQAQRDFKPFEIYDSLINLQMLDAHENESKNNKPLAQWVDENCGQDKEGFLQKHLIPDTDLSLENFDNFIEQRKVLLVDKFMGILNEKA